VTPTLDLNHLAFFIDQCDQGYGRLANARCQFRQIVKNLLRHGVEHAYSQSTLSRFFSFFGTGARIIGSELLIIPLKEENARVGEKL